jgi:hypothetical protein
MEDIFAIAEELRNEIKFIIKKYEELCGVELVGLKFYNYYSHIEEKNQICGVLNIKEKK